MDVEVRTVHDRQRVRTISNAYAPSHKYDLFHRLFREIGVYRKEQSYIGRSARNAYM
jgi:hypothetical protein